MSATGRKKDLKELSYQHAIELEWDSVSQVITLRKAGNVAKVLVGSRLVIVNGEKKTLSSSVYRYQGMVVVPSDFSRKVINELSAGSVAIRMQRIVIDPGHGGKDPGAIGKKGAYEKDIVLDIARRLKKELQKNGFKVFMTRDKDVFVSLDKRVELASKKKADLFISIHANSSSASNVRGVEVYYLRDLNEWSRYREYLTPENKRAVHRFDMKENDLHLDRIVYDMMYVYKQAASKGLARKIAKNTSFAASSNNRGTKSSAFRVLKNTLIPAVLVEVGFLSNKKEEKCLETCSHRQKIANSLAKSIAQYANE